MLGTVREGYNENSAFRNDVWQNVRFLLFCLAFCVLAVAKEGLGPNVWNLKRVCIERKVVHTDTKIFCYI